MFTKHQSPYGGNYAWGYLVPDKTAQMAVAVAIGVKYLYRLRHTGPGRRITQGRSCILGPREDLVDPRVHASSKQTYCSRLPQSPSPPRHICPALGRYTTAQFLTLGGRVTGHQSDLREQVRGLHTGARPGQVVENQPDPRGGGGLSIGWVDGFDIRNAGKERVPLSKTLQRISSTKVATFWKTF